MSYRIKVINNKGKSHQLFGNNESYDELFEYLRKKGVYMSWNDPNFYDFKIDNLQELLDILTNYLKYKCDEIKRTYDSNIWDLTPDTGDEDNIINYLLDIYSNSYIMQIPNLLKVFEDDIEWYYNKEKHQMQYKIKDDHELFLEGW